MALYLLKPVMWNSAGYQRPAGDASAPKSYPGQHGFGHEEWNNSPRLVFEEQGQRLRAFHTEGIKQAPVAAHAGRIVVFMIASHDRLQQLVGVAANALHLGGEDQLAERQRIAARLKVRDMWRDAWQLPGVQRRFDGDRQALRTHFAQTGHWVPNWICPADTFFWPDNPVTLVASQVTGKSVLPRMFNSYQAIDDAAAGTIMSSVPESDRTAAWRRVLDAIRSAPDVLPMADFPPPATRATTRLAEILSRIGQGGFRSALLTRWGGGCAVTDLFCPELLRASHIKPWASSSPQERLDPDNGLLLAAHLDALFDRGLISFDDNGEMLISDRLPASERRHLRLPSPLRIAPTAAMKQYLAIHRQTLR